MGINCKDHLKSIGQCIYDDGISCECDKYKMQNCPDCNGSGTIIGTTQGCCGNANPDGSCCGISIPEPTQEQCPRCEATGFITEI